MRKIKKYRSQKLRKAGEKRNKRAISRKSKVKNLRRDLLGLDNEGIRIFKRKRKYSAYTFIKAPEVFSFIKEPEKFSKFINKVKKCYQRKKKVFIDLDYTTFIGYDALVVLLSILIRFKASKIGFDGSIPILSDPKRILIESGFLDNLYRQIGDSDRYKFLKGGTISTHAYKKVDSELTSEIITNASEHIWGEVRRCPGVQKALVELMHNTNNHAEHTTKGNKHWFLSVQHIKREKKVCFSFVDFGVGIFDNLDNKGKDSKWYNWDAHLLKIFKWSNNSELLKLILQGDLHTTVTKKPYRGKGLPGIHDVLKRNQFNNLHIITNDVFADVGNKNFSKMKNKFSGTFVYWELTTGNHNLPE